jgi:hypothetical protein
MPIPSPAKILRAHFCESDTYRDQPLFEAMVAKCRDMNIAGATVFRGLEGYGETAEIHRHHLIARDEPMVLIVVDAAEKIERLIPAIEDMMKTGVIAVSDADMIRCEKTRPGHHV